MSEKREYDWVDKIVIGFMVGALGFTISIVGVGLYIVLKSAGLI